MKRTIPSIAFVLIGLTIGACDAGRTEGTGSEPARITTSTGAPTSATTPVGTALPRGTILKLQAGATYTAEEFYVPISIRAEEAGWWSIEARELWVYLQHHPSDESDFDVDLSILAYDPSATTETLVTEIVDSTFTAVLGEPRDTAVAEYRAVVVDVSVPVIPGWETACEGDGGGTVVGYSRFSEIGLALMTSDHQARASFGVRLCRAARIWIVDVDGERIAIVGGTSSVEAFDDLAGVVERLVGGIAFEA